METTDEIFSRLRNGEAQDLDALFRALHLELKALARNCLGGGGSDATLTPTGLVNEVYLKLSSARELSLADQQHFFACAARAMRQIVVDVARAAMAGKRGGDAIFVTLTESDLGQSDEEVVALSEAMDTLREVNEPLHDLVELKFFAGLTMDEIAALRQQSVRSLHRDWARARAFLHAQLQAA